MSKVFLRKQFSNYLGENRALDDIVVRFIGDGPSPSPTPTPITPTPTPTPSVTPNPTITPTNTPSITPTNTPTIYSWTIVDCDTLSIVSYINRYTNDLVNDDVVRFSGMCWSVSGSSVFNSPLHLTDGFIYPDCATCDESYVTPTPTPNPTNTPTLSPTPTPSAAGSMYKLQAENTDFLQTEGGDDINIEN
jgi:hypothetical protein